MDETEDVEVIETHEALVEDVPLSVALVDKSATEMCLVETLVFEVTPAIEGIVTEHVASASLETPQGEIAKSEVNITAPASAGKNCGVLSLAHVFLCC